MVLTRQYTATRTAFVSVDKRRLVRLGFIAFAASLAAFALAREPIGAFVVAPALGFAYFATTTSMNTIFQGRLADHERGRAMSLWSVSYTHLRAHETVLDLVCRLLLEKKNNKIYE